MFCNTTSTDVETLSMFQNDFDSLEKVINDTSKNYCPLVAGLIRLTRNVFRLHLGWRFVSFCQFILIECDVLEQ